ncbi:MAG: MFS transporter [Bacteroidetes bacterium]|nr:MAG: MFS transporter [Bacteroidota bacterium]
MNKKSHYPVYRYVILAVFMLITVAIEIQWLTHAAVARPAEVFYGGQFNPDSILNIDFLAMIYMVAFLVMSFPASYVIDTYGIRTGLAIGAVMLAVFSLMKAAFANSFTGVVIAQTGLALAQPFILNGVTAVTARWFPLYQRGMAAGLLALAQYLGIIVAMLVTPMLVGSDPSLPEYGTGFGKMLWIYGIFSAIAALCSLLLIKDRKPQDGEQELDRYAFWKGLRHILSNRDMRITMFLFLIGLGIFNAISSMTDSIAERAGVEDSDGLIGGVMLIGGIIGAVIIPTLSDRYKRRKPFLVICIAGMLPAVAALAFAGNLADDPETIYRISLAASFTLGFFIMSAGPLGFQYAAEISYPAPESTSQGILLWVGQLTGMIFVAGMSIRENQYLGIFMNIFVILSILVLIATFVLRESPFMETESGEEYKE